MGSSADITMCMVPSRPGVFGICSLRPGVQQEHKNDFSVIACDDIATLASAVTTAARRTILERSSPTSRMRAWRIVAVPNEVTRFEKARPWPRRGGTRSPRRAGGARHPSLQFAEPSNNGDAVTLAA